jgi:acetyltransferase-like isoleucine patch superfamily enzyme
MINLIIKIFNFLMRRIIYHPFNFFLIKSQNIKYEHYPNIKGTISLRNQGNIYFKGKAFLISGLKYNPTGGDNKLSFWTGPNGLISIGENTGISNSAIVSFESVKIGNNVLIGGGCKIYDTDFHPLNFEDRIIGNEKSDKVKTRAIEICDNVFIGGHSIVLKGVTIGKGSVIGAGSVVTKNIPENEIWAGNPARFIKKLTP